MPSIVIDSLSKRFDGVQALSNISLEIDDREFMVLLGPSGCGKTTLLRCVAGLEQPDTGSIRIGDRTVYSRSEGVDIPPRERRIGMVFQNYALYPHMDVFENVAFGLRMRKTRKKEIQSRVSEALELVDLTGLERRSPRQLSGGQRQRVAVARTLVTKPQELLFDEPLSNLDPTLRVNLRAQLRRLHKQIGATSLYVTHDQNEAMILADRIAVLQDGVIVQVDEPRTVYDHPATVKVAEFTGNPRTNILTGEISRSGDRLIIIPDDDPYCFIELPESVSGFVGRRVDMNCRPEEVEIASHLSEDLGRLPVLSAMPDGSHIFVHLRLGDTMQQIIARGSIREFARIGRNDLVTLGIRRGNIFDQDTGYLLHSFGYEDSDQPALPQHGVEVT